MRKTSLALVGGMVLALLSGCSSTPVGLNPVGPAPSRPLACSPQGSLQVFTAVEAHEIDDNTYYYPHPSYSIYTESGGLWKYIPNHLADVDESPAWVGIPAGNYMVKAEANFDVWGTVAYPVKVPVVVQADRKTKIHLEADWQAPANAPTSELVYLPGGKPVGWRSRSVAQLNRGP
jgi:hypothetical protein